MSWKSIPGFPGYEVSDQGQVRSFASGKACLLQPWQSKDGKYRSVTLSKNGQKFKRDIHRLVLLAFVGPCPKGMEARHFPKQTGDKLKNLSWATRSKNQKDRHLHGTKSRGKNQLGRDMKSHPRCPRCHQPLPIERHGVQMSPLKSRIFDLTEKAGTAGISTEALISQINHQMSVNTLKTHISQINDLIEAAGLTIVSRQRKRFLVPMEKRPCT